MITAGAGAKLLRVVALKVDHLHRFAVRNGKPGFSK